MAEVVIADGPCVAIVAAPEDGVAARLVRALEYRGHRVLSMDGPSAARAFTIRLKSGVPEVSPEMPMFLRSSAWWHAENRDTVDGTFLAQEAYGTLWAASSLSSAVVVNRPYRTIHSETLGMGTIQHLLATAGRDTAHTTGRRPAEVRASSPLHVRLDDSRRLVWGRNADGVSAPVPDLPPEVPLRAREVDVDEAYEIITVVGDRAFTATSDERTNELDLQVRSIELVALAHFRFATVWWAVNDREALAVRLDPYPAETCLRYSWAGVEAALCEELTS